MLSLTAAGDCPARCQCLKLPPEYLVAVSCAYQRRSDIPVDFPPDTEYIKFEGNNLSELSSNFNFPVLPKLRRLDIQTCQLRKIGSDAFSHLPALETLVLSDNRIETIEAGAFRGLSALRLLDLERNNITELPGSVFSGLTLDSLWLTNNQLKNIRTDTFKGSSVVTLKLSGNAIRTPPANALVPLRASLTRVIWNDNRQPLKLARLAFRGVNLLELSLADSRLDSNTSFLEHVNATLLYLSGNQLSASSLNLHKYLSLATVRNLHMRNMSLTAISSDILPNSRALLTIDLSENKLTVVTGDAFKHVTGLTTLRLNENLLTRLPEALIETLPHLQELRMFANQITTLDRKSLAPYADGGLHVLDVQNNRVQVMDESLRPLLDKIGTFMINGNPLHCNCELLWYRNWLNGPGVSEHGLYTQCVTPKREYVVYLPKKSFVCTVPRIAAVKPTKYVNEGDDVFLTCSAVADPAPVVEWTAPSGEAISITPSQNRSRTKTMAVWRVAAISRRQAGLYTCSANNREGNVTVSVCVGVRIPDSTWTVCDDGPATGLSLATTAASLALKTPAVTSSLEVSTTRDGVTTSSSVSPTTVVHSRVTTVQRRVTTTQPRVNATSVVNSRELSSTTEETTTVATDLTETTGSPDTVILPKPSSDKQSSSSRVWIIALFVCLVIAIIAAVIVTVVCVRRKPFSRSTYLGTESENVANEKIKMADTEKAMILPRTQPGQPISDKLKTAENDKVERDSMLSHEETSIDLENAGKDGRTAEMVLPNSRTTSETSQDSAMLISESENSVFGAGGGITEDDSSKHNPAFVLSPGSYATETDVEESCKDNNGKMSENNSEQNNVGKQKEPCQHLVRSYSENPDECGVSVKTGRLSTGETEA